MEAFFRMQASARLFYMLSRSVTPSANRPEGEERNGCGSQADADEDHRRCTCPPPCPRKGRHAGIRAALVCHHTGAMHATPCGNPPAAAPGGAGGASGRPRPPQPRRRRRAPRAGRTLVPRRVRERTPTMVGCGRTPTAVHDARAMGGAHRGRCRLRGGGGRASPPPSAPVRRRPRRVPAPQAGV